MRKLSRVPALTLLVVLAGLPACGAVSSLDDGPCDSQAPTCIAAPVDDPCGGSTVVPAACDAEAHAWACPRARVSTRAPPTRPRSACRCRTWKARSRPVGGWGLGGSFVRVPTDDGRCLWIAEQVATPMGDVIPNVAIEVDREAPFGSCPTTGSIMGGVPTSVVRIEGGADASAFSWRRPSASEASRGWSTGSSRRTRAPSSASRISAAGSAAGTRRSSGSSCRGRAPSRSRRAWTSATRRSSPGTTPTCGAARSRAGSW